MSAVGAGGILSVQVSVKTNLTFIKLTSDIFCKF